jgi:hypothetical protein
MNNSDPVAYRIEPLLYPQDYNVDDIPPALYLTSPGDDVRLHIKAKQLTDVVRKTLFSNPSSTSSKEKTGWSALIDGAVALASNVDLSSSASATAAASSSTTTDRSASDRDNGKPKATIFPLGGRSPRVDYSLQPYMIDNEYIRSVRGWRMERRLHFLLFVCGVPLLTPSPFFYPFLLQRGDGPQFLLSKC